MRHNEFEENRFDRTTALVLDGFSRRISRRSMLVRTGRFAFSLLGVSLLPLLPVDRIVRMVEAQSGGCGIWELCGMWGRLCNSCQCCGGTVQACPGCTYQGGFWATCCPVRTSNGTFTGEYRNVKYSDCCGQQGNPNTKGNSNTCLAGEFCRGNGIDPPQSQPSWCDGAPGEFRCTHYVVLGTCTP